MYINFMKTIKITTNNVLGDKKKEKKIKFIITTLFFLFICYIIYLADTADNNFAFRIIGHIPYGDKFMHALLYGTMAFLCNWVFNFKTFIFIKINIQLGLFIVFIFALLEEFSQYFISSRTFDIFDILADIIGIVLVSFIKLK